MTASLRRWLLAACLVLLTQTAGHAQQAPAPQSAEARQQELIAAGAAAERAGTNGPADIPLLDQAVLHLPESMLFVPPNEASRLLRAWGNRVPTAPVGLVLGTARNDDWVVVIRFVKEGYIKDDDAKDWKADELLTSIREGAEESNKDRVARGFEEMEVIGWIAPPKYDPATHRLVWSLAQKRKGQPDGGVQAVNYNTYALGRDGYFSLALLTDSKRIATERQVAGALLAGLSYLDGKRYEDFNASTDHIAEYGLAALVGVVAAKKLGLLALAGVFVLKFAKIGAVLLAGAGLALRKIFRGRRNTGGDA